jgi:hypothetical protein
VGGSSFAAGALAEHFSYAAAFVMAAAALGGAAVAGRYVFAAGDEAVPVVTEARADQTAP